MKYTTAQKAVLYNPALYNNRTLVPEFPQYFARWQALSAKAREKLVCRLDTPYSKDGSDAMNQTLDIFPALDSHAPVLVFIHGGYWRSLDKSDQSFIAPAFVDKGACVVIPNYALCPMTEDQPVTIADITMQMVQAVAWTYRNIAKFGGDPKRITLVGHSAGGHLVGMLLACQWSAYAKDLPDDLVTNGISLSGLFDLDPIAKTPQLQASLKLTPKDTLRCSPVAMSPPAHARLQAFVGAAESDAFIAQNHLIQDAWGTKVVPVCETVSVDGRGCNHFSVLDAFVNARSGLYGAVTQALSA